MLDSLSVFECFLVIRYGNRLGGILDIADSLYASEGLPHLDIETRKVLVGIKSTLCASKKQLLLA